MPIPKLIMTLLAFAGVSGGMMVLFTAVLSASHARMRRLQELKEGRPQYKPTLKRKKPKVPDPAPLLTGFLQRSDFGRKLQTELLRAGLMLRPSEFLIISGICALTGSVAGLKLGHSVVFGVLLLGAGALGPYMHMKSKQTQRQRQISTQLPDALDLLSSSLRSGHSFLRGLQVVVTQMSPPITEEFERAIDEVRLGQSLDLALTHILDRTGNYDLELVISAVQTQLSIGGNLAEIMDNISSMIRERVRLAGEIAAATAEGRMSAGILGGMPFAMAFLINVVSPGYMAPLFTSTFGLILLGAAGGMMLTGILIIKKMLEIDI
ncbi:MAG: type II secretion system F family protein [Bacteroidota bacterium]